MQHTDEIPEKVDFNFDVKPILSDRCFVCHGPDENAVEAELQLHTEETAYAALGDNKDRNAIKPGRPHQSEMYKRISSDDPDFMMPPPESNLDLNEREITILYLMGIDHEKLTFKQQGRRFRLTDVHGEVIEDILS